MWNNEDWAKNHIKKHNVTPQEAWEAVYIDPRPMHIVSPYQLRYPPYLRYWTIGKTINNRLLFVVFEINKEIKNLITAFEPDVQRIKLYETLKKKSHVR